jgi:hypothetical protein
MNAEPGSREAQILAWASACVLGLGHDLDEWSQMPGSRTWVSRCIYCDRMVLCQDSPVKLFGPGMEDDCPLSPFADDLEG